MWKTVVAPAVLVSIVWIAGSAVSTYYIHRVYESQSRVLTENVATIRAAWAMQDALWKIQAVVAEAAGNDRREIRAEVSKLESAFAQHLGEAEKTSFTPEEQTLVKDLREHFAVYRDHIEAQLQLSRLPGAPAQDAEKEKAMRLAREVAEPCRRLIDVNERILADSTARSARLSTVLSLFRFAIVTVGPIVGVLFGLWIARGLHRSISQISVTLTDATGSLDRPLGSVKVYSPADLPGLHQQVQAVAGVIRQVMEELQQTRRQAMSAERLAAVGELAAGIAHELRNPLTAVKLLIQTAAQRQTPAGLVGKQFQVVQQEIARMESTIQGLLDFARPPQLHRVPHDLRTPIRRALNLVEGRARQQNVSVAEELPNTPVTVNGDPEQLHQIFVNLLLNGIEAMPQGGVLDVALQAGGKTCRVSISDSGSGIQQQILERIFEPFVTSKEHGTGLGLAVSYRIAEEHGGTLLAANRAEGGAVFTLELPLFAQCTNSEAARDRELPMEQGALFAAPARSDAEVTHAKTPGD